jgi:hypothetical protein
VLILRLFGKVDGKYLEPLKRGAGEGWRRPVGQIVWEIKYYKQ